MPEKQFNHFIPRLILKHWEIPINENRYGVHVLDIEKDRKYIAESRGKRGFSFAAKKDLYVPRISDERRTELEDWFSGCEGILDKTINRIEKLDNFPLFDSTEDMNRFLLGILSFKYRTQFNIDKVKEFLKNNQAVKNQIDPSKDIDILALENIVNASTEDFIEYSNFEMQIYISKDESILICDRPFLENLIDGYSFMPLTNKIFIGLRLSQSEQSIATTIINNGLVESFNNLWACNSRKWIVADCENQLAKYEKIAKEEKQDTVEYNPVKHLTKGYEFNK
jgi:hypothetical protein